MASTHTTAGDLWRASPSGPLRGRVRAPGDKSISHRALILGGLAEGVTEIDGLLEGDDVLRTAAAVRALGAKVDQLAPGRWRVEGQGGFTAPGSTVDCGNSGTGVRLLMGAAAGYPIEVRFDGDGSLRKRPMGRVTDPLSLMGARFETAEGGRLPLVLRGGGLKAIDYRLPVPSAQVKSAVLLAALNAGGVTTVLEPEPTRDHTERMLRAFGAAPEVSDGPDGRLVRLAPASLDRKSTRLNSSHTDISRMPSSA